MNLQTALAIRRGLSNLRLSRVVSDGDGAAVISTGGGRGEDDEDEPAKGLKSKVVLEETSLH